MLNVVQKVCQKDSQMWNDYLFMKDDLKLVSPNHIYGTFWTDTTHGGEFNISINMSVDEIEHLTNNQISELLIQKLVTACRNFSPDDEYEPMTAQNYDSPFPYIEDLKEAKDNFNKAAEKLEHFPFDKSNSS